MSHFYYVLVVRMLSIKQSPKDVDELLYGAFKYHFMACFHGKFTTKTTTLLNMVIWGRRFKGLDMKVMLVKIRIDDENSPRNEVRGGWQYREFYYRSTHVIVPYSYSFLSFSSLCLKLPSTHPSHSHFCINFSHFSYISRPKGEINGQKVGDNFTISRH